METNNWRICRICLKEPDNPRNSKAITDIDDEDNIQIITKINYCSQVELKNPIKNLPLRICTKCYENLKLTYKFCMICQDSEKKFQELEELNNISKNCKTYNKPRKNRNKMIIESIDKEMSILKNIKFEIVAPKEEPTDIQNAISLFDLQLNNNMLLPSTDLVADDSDELKNIEIISNSKNIKTSQNLDSNNSLTSDPVRRRKYFKKPKLLEYRCEVCQEPFNTRSHMTSHMKTSHTQAYKCKDCNKAFDSNIARNKHERRAHMDPAVRPHKCDFCVRTFYRLDLLKKHKRVHTGEKPFVCEKCGTAFKQIHHLTNHSKSMTPCVLKMSIKI